MDVDSGKSKGKRSGAADQTPRAQARKGAANPPPSRDDKWDPWAIDREGADWAEPSPGHDDGSGADSAAESA
eukprot:11202845-Lingulodinium_polyedra.AAC.1